MVFSNNLLLGAADAGGGYEIENSVRLDGVGDMSRTVGSDGDLREWSWSFWVKRSGLGTNGGLGFNIGGTYADASNRSIVRFYSSSNGTDDFYWAERSGGAWREDQWTIAQYRDPSAWYHILLVWDTDGGTTPRARRYINGVQITDLGGSPAAAANADSGTNKAGTFQLFDQAGFPGREFEGYCAEMYFVDGSALEPTDFGEFNADGVWIPKQVTGITYGSNGFYLDFADSSDLGKDVSGNNNDFTSSGLTTTDQMLDTPTDNFWTLTPLDSSGTLANGNLQNKGGGSTNTHAPAFPTTGKWYVEIDCNDINTGTAGAHFFGICDASVNFNQSFADHAAISAGQQRGGQLKKNNSNTTTGTAVNDGDIIALAFDADNLTLDLYVNNSQSGSQITGLTDVQYKLWIQDGASVTDMQVNFGQTGGFTYTPPTGFNALSTTNLDDPTIADPTAYMQTLAYASTGTITAFVQDGNSQFEPGLVWEKSRTGANNHLWFDQVRGATKFIRSDTTNAENTVADTLTSFNSNGFTAGADSVNWGINYPGRNNVAWMWKANGAGSSNTDGSITSTVSNNSTAGFSIGTYTGIATGPGDAPGTVGHGLGISPGMIIIKDLTAATEWYVWHQRMSNPAQSFIYLNTTGAAQTSTDTWNNTAPTSSVFSIGWDTNVNTYGNSHVFYAFAEIPGYSSFGSYTGNGSTDGPFVYTGFAPEFIMVKSSSNSGTNWDILDATRETFNTRGNQLLANSSATEASNDHECDFLSNGFKWRDGSGSNNGSGYTIIYMAFAKHPFGGDGVAPATAR